MILQNEYNNMAGSASLVNREQSNYNTEIRQANYLIRQINDSAAKYQPYSKKMKEIINSLPLDIKLHSMTIDAKNKKFLLSGTAKYRDSMLKYGEILKQTLWLKNITAPVSQLFEKENINFEIKADIVKEGAN